MRSPSLRADARCPGRMARLGFSLVPAVLFVVLVALAGCTRYQPYSAGTGIVEPAVPEPVELAAGPEDDTIASDAGALGGPGSESAAQDLGSPVVPVNPAILGEAARLAVGRDFDPVYFEPDSYELTFTTRRSLHEYAQWLGDNPHVWITLEGHDDESGTVEYGLNLAMARAVAVKERLAGLGVNDERLFTISFGEIQPAVPDAPAEPAPANRRVEFLAFVAPEGGIPSSSGGNTSAPPPALEPLEPPRSFELP